MSQINKQKVLVAKKFLVLCFNVEIFGYTYSPVLFTIHLEKALREIRLDLDQINKPNEIEYADDVNFVSTKKYLDLDKITPTMKKYNLI